MAKYTVTRKCGCTETWQLYGKHDARFKEIAHLEETDCANCRAAEAQRHAAEKGLPALTGSPKQVAWASDLRDRILPVLKETLEKIDGDEKASSDPRCAGIVAGIQKLRDETRASVWIDANCLVGATPHDVVRHFVAV